MTPGPLIEMKNRGSTSRPRGMRTPSHSWIENRASSNSANCARMLCAAVSCCVSDDKNESSATGLPTSSIEGRMLPDQTRRADSTAGYQNPEKDHKSNPRRPLENKGVRNLIVDT